MSSLSLRQLRYFDALADCGHFGKAAARCHISQPALSTQIRELERELGCALVERTARGVVLTPAGAEVLERARAVLTGVESLSEAARREARLLEGTLRLGVIPTIAPYLLPRLLPLVRERHPHAALSLRESQTAHLVEELIEGRLDVVLAALPLGRTELEERALFEEPFVLALPAGHPLAGPGEIPVEVVGADSLLLLEEGHCLRDQALSVCKHIAPGHIESFGATSLATLVQLVAAGMGLTLLPDMAVPVETGPSTQVVLRRFVPPQPKRTVGLAWRRTTPLRSHFEALGKLVAECAGSAPGGPDTHGA